MQVLRSLRPSVDSARQLLDCGGLLPQPAWRLREGPVACLAIGVTQIYYLTNVGAGLCTCGNVTMQRRGPCAQQAASRSWPESNSNSRLRAPGGKLIQYVTLYVVWSRYRRDNAQYGARWLALSCLLAALCLASNPSRDAFKALRRTRSALSIVCSQVICLVRVMAYAMWLEWSIGHESSRSRVPFRRRIVVLTASLSHNLQHEL